MKRRDMLVSSGAALLGWSAFPLGLARAGEVKKESKRQKVLYFTRSAGFEHSVVARKGGKLSSSEVKFTEMGAEQNVEVVCTKDGGASTATWTSSTPSPFTPRGCSPIRSPAAMRRP